ncbi:MAG: hypothetical protein GQ578_05430 [Desulfuromonadaceae bacterium]|nr:hypothetical protein [Desulfuromonadaceae bacterium]
MTADLSTLIAAAETGALILTANERLFRYLRGLYDQTMQAAGKKVWDTPQIISYQGWQSRSLSELGESWRLLGKNPALRLWEQLIEDSCRGSDLELLQVGKTAEKAHEAYQALMEHGVSLDGYFLTDDQRIFKTWLKWFSAECQRQQWLDRSQLPARICRALEVGDLPLPQQMFLVGFDQLPPGAELLQRTCHSLGGRCDEFQFQPDVASRQRLVAAPDADQEIELAARWARQLLDQGVESIGVVVPDLKVRRKKIERVFRAQIDPGAAPGLQDEEANFTLSLGGPLIEQGVIHAACEILAVAQQLTLEQVSFLLRTPYLGASQLEADSRARLDRRLRSFRQQQISLSRFTNLVAEDDQQKNLTTICNQLKEANSEKSTRLPGGWAERFTAELQKVGWPGDRPRSSREFQALKAWREKLLPSLAALDQVSQPIGRRQALALLRRLVKEIDFQLESPTGPLQVIGLLESGGLHFEHLWVMGLSETTLPAAARPNPFIPYELQENYGMPHASAARELAFAERVIERLKTASPDIIFSYPLWEGDCELRPSPLLPEETGKSDITLADAQDFLSLIRQNLPVLQQLKDDQGPELEDGKGSGGTGILKDQAHCPFRAFVHYRLAGRELDKASPGLDALTRGDLVHLALERLWTRLQDQQALLQLSEDEQRSMLSELVERSVEDYFAKGNRPSEQLLQLEKERIATLIDDWLTTVERQRDPFRVAELEQEHVEQIGPLQIKTKVDRIDELAAGHRVILDYKTGSSLKPEDLFREPLLEPQLPIYAVAEKGTEADAVAFAQVRRGDCKLLGVVREQGMLGKVKDLSGYAQAVERGITAWPQLLDDWRGQLEQLAEDFVAGQARVRPFDLQRSCQYCDLRGLCRIDEAAVVEGGE